MKTFLRKRQLAKRYGVSERTIDRMRSEGRLSQPDLYAGRYPLWGEETVEADERAAILRTPVPKATSKESNAA
jgi:hypothetical protein